MIQCAGTTKKWPADQRFSILSRVHIIEDDTEISSLLSTYLTGRGFECHVSSSAEDAQAHKPTNFDIFIVDIMLPGIDGLRFCQWVRNTSDVPIIILSAEKGDAKRIHGIELGADDYLEKPFNPRELLARMNALLRRSSVGGRNHFTGKVGFSGWVLDRTHQKLHGPGALHVPLSSTEYQLISILIAAVPEPVSREDIGSAILNVALDPEDRRVDILVSRLRKKLSAIQHDADFIRTVRNRGYQFCAALQDMD
ncbi:DNA-binding response regulator [Phaeobacter gallaeciensis]|uniref:DNA-binding response regulator n=2 Tax=Roseobacteraceae TaxID=2854170 RepID=A0A366WPI8_9RHOB|nr:response regulator transcription factor [Phaeobacter gallaeciensis]MBT3139749.1 response regulator transcription factor [Falsiruegeria litorea]MBT8168032.1 response regulator transcription factor [Falsiruegeria litorea]RBW51326.1 DNA-binding response regulator [Phaeobacter gallaeciensis]